MLAIAFGFVAHCFAFTFQGYNVIVHLKMISEIRVQSVFHLWLNTIFQASPGLAAGLRQGKD